MESNGTTNTQKEKLTKFIMSKNLSPRTNRNQISLTKKLRYLISAMYDDPEYVKSKKCKTDVIGIACQYSSHPKLKREDFKELFDMNIGELVNKEGFKFKF